MKKYTIIIITLLSINVFGQDLDNCGMDNHPVLTQTEADFLNTYIENTEGEQYDFRNKKVIFVTGNSAQQISTKAEYFRQIKVWNKNDDKIATWFVVLNEKEKAISGGYDVIVTHWVKLLTKKRKRKIIESLVVSK